MSVATGKKSTKLRRKKYLQNIFLPLLLIFLVFFIYVILQSNPFKIRKINLFQKDQIVEESEANKINYSKETAYTYSNFGIQGTSWLSFRDVPDFISKFVKGKKTLDFGCGAGRSTRFLKNLNLEVIGVDISSEFIKQANRVDKVGKYLLMKKGRIPFPNNSYDFVFSSHVLLMVPTKAGLNEIFQEVHRVLKKDGIFIVVTGSEEMHSYRRNWISYQTDFPENISPSSGTIVKLKIKEVNSLFCDYNWTNEDYLNVIKNNGFEIAKIHFPLGKDADGINWKSEKEASPYVIYVLKKK